MTRENNEHEKRQAKMRIRRGPSDPDIRRIDFAQEATHSVELEGLAVSMGTAEDIQDYVDGTVSSDDLVERTIKRYKEETE